MIERIVDFWF